MEMPQQKGALNKFNPTGAYLTYLSFSTPAPGLLGIKVKGGRGPAKARLLPVALRTAHEQVCQARLPRPARKSKQPNSTGVPTKE
jgi:hypothetical protein